MPRVSPLDKMLADQQAEVLEAGDAIEALAAAAEADNRDLTDEESAQISTLTERSNALLKTIPQTQAAIDQRDKIKAAKAQVPGEMITTGTGDVSQVPLNVLPARATMVKTEVFNSDLEAYSMGQWLAATMCGNEKAQAFCRERGIVSPRNDMDGTTGSLGGYTVPTPLAATIIRLVEEFSVWRRNARTAVMTANTLDVPAYAAGFTAYWIAAQGDSITASDLTFAQVNLVAKKMGVFTAMSTELSDDSIISMADLITRDIATQFAFAEDDAAFNGDGTATYGGITGVKSALQAGSQVVTGAPATTAWAQLALADLHEAQGLLPQYSGINPKWYMSSYAYYNAVVPLLVALGGTDMRQVEAGGMQMLLGSPVEFTQVLPKATTATNDLLIVYGDLDLGAYSGQRRQVTIRQSYELLMQTDQIAVAATQRVDAVTHSVGDATDPGAIIGIYAAAT